MKPRASILMPIWNCAAFVEEALRSVFAQTTDDMEVLVFDDASDDGTFERAEETIRRHGRGVTILNRQDKHKGARNFHEMAQVASSDIIIMAHGDDVSLPGRFERILAEFAAAEDVMLISSNAQITDAGGVPQGLITPLALDMDVSDPIAAQDQPNGLTALGATFAYRRALIDAFSLDTDLFVYGDDLVLQFRAVLLGRSRFIAEPLINWRVHGGNGHLRHGASATEDCLAEQHDGLLQQCLAIRAIDLETAIGQTGETETLLEARRRLAILSDSYLKSWLRRRGRLLNAGYRPVWTLETPHKAEPVRLAASAPGAWIQIKPGLSGGIWVSGQEGWHAADGWGIWSGGTAALRLCLPDSPEPGVWIEIQGRLPQGPTARTVALSCGGELIWAAEFEAAPSALSCLAFLPRRLAVNGIATLQLDVSPPAVPREMSAESKDGRQLGIGAVSFRIVTGDALLLGAARAPAPHSDVPGWFPPHHAELIARCVETYRPYLAVEIGSFAGRSSLVLFESLRRLGRPYRLVCIDTWETRIDEAFLENVHVLDLASNFPETWPSYASAARGSDSFALFAKTLADHPDFAAKTEVRREDGGRVNLGPWKAGLVFIDGNHEEADVLRDFRNMLGQVLPGCVVLFHDYGGAFTGVKRAVDAICAGPGVTILAIESDMAIIQLADPVMLCRWYDESSIGSPSA